MSDTSEDHPVDLDDDGPQLPPDVSAPDKPSGREPYEALRGEAAAATPPAVPEGEPPPSPPVDPRADALKEWKAKGAPVLELRGIEFRVMTDLPAMVVLDMSVAADPDAEPLDQVLALRSFLTGAIHDDDLQLWNRTLRRSKPRIMPEELNEIGGRLMSLVTGRPT